MVENSTSDALEYVVRHALWLSCNSCFRLTIKNPTFHPTDQSATGPFRHHRTGRSMNLGRIRHHRTSPTICFHLIIPRSWVRSAPALLDTHGLPATCVSIGREIGNHTVIRLAK